MAEEFCTTKESTEDMFHVNARDEKKGTKEKKRKGCKKQKKKDRKTDIEKLNS